ncbi:uncharacterized protein [Nicotiana sylvestris]|uniref:uncharacterized protein n=1 Tax=Nicotiana sylvestris TaxID=4096 RepID=UPI00388C9AEE
MEDKQRVYKEEEDSQPARKLNFERVNQPRPTMAEAVKNNRMHNQGGYPAFNGMLQFVYWVWHFITTPRVFLQDDGNFIFRFESEEDKNAIQQNGSYTFRNRPMILKQWEADFQLLKELLSVLPIWVCFPGLPLLYWYEENLGRIESSLGKPICTDSLTIKGDRVSYAIMFIEMDIAQPLPNFINTKRADGSIWEQKIDYEWRPILCEDCSQLGHKAVSCPAKTTMQQKDGKHLKRKALSRGNKTDRNGKLKQQHLQRSLLYLSSSLQRQLHHQ